MNRKLIAILVLLIASLACSKSPDYVVRGWTVTPSMSPVPTPSNTPPPPGPTIIFITQTAGVQFSVVLADVLEIREGPGTNYTSHVDHLSRGDVIIILDCVYDPLGEAWVKFRGDVVPVAGWSAVTSLGSVFIKPLPAGCHEYQP